jgi:transcription elongation factor Elf1
MDRGMVICQKSKQGELPGAKTIFNARGCTEIRVHDDGNQRVEPKRLQKNISCYLCDGQAKEYSTDITGRSAIKCPSCGHYHLTEKAKIVLELILNADRGWLASCLKGRCKETTGPIVLDDLDEFKILAKAVAAG